MSAIEIRRIDHVVLRVRDIEASLRFWRDALGCTVERSSDALGLYQLRAGASLIDLVPGAKGAESEANMDHFCVGIEAADVAAVQTYLTGHGVEIAAGPMQVYGARGTGTSLYVRDPERNVVELKLLGTAVADA